MTAPRAEPAVLAELGRGLGALLTRQAELLTAMRATLTARTAPHKLARCRGAVRRTLALVDYLERRPPFAPDDFPADVVQADANVREQAAALREQATRLAATLDQRLTASRRTRSTPIPPPDGGPR